MLKHHSSMKILVVGASGQIGRRLVPKLIDDGHQVEVCLRNQAHAPEFERMHASVRFADLEGDLGTLCAGVDCVIFTAGSGGSTGKDKTLTVDLWGAIQCIQASEAAGVKRFVMISALKASEPNRGSDALKPYLVAKHAADEILKHSTLNYSILRPGRLTDSTDSRPVRVFHESETADYAGSISRANVAEFIRQHLRSVERNVILDLIESVD
ncbi:Unannotated [Lentimonas sp. CC19]|nr:Unannotated [Lentimonas sp. CC19]CAA6692614.1 Unannotated [Lentimonas sp. CC10]CAA7069221.1 Unannotated [Lentimonas sp. CC11]